MKPEMMDEDTKRFAAKLNEINPSVYPLIDEFITEQLRIQEEKEKAENKASACKKE